MYGGQEHESNWTHELAAGAASFAGMKAWEDHQRKEGMFDTAIHVPRRLSLTIERQAR